MSGSASPPDMTAHTGVPAQSVAPTPLPSSPVPDEKRVPAVRKRDFGILPIPKWRRHDPRLSISERFPWTWRLNLVFAIATTVSVMNLYYIQPMQADIADHFGVSYDAAARVATLVQAGYGTGTLLIVPLGDLVRRRPLVLVLMGAATALSVGLARARSVAMLQGLSFALGLCTVTPQVMLPWTADLAPGDRRAAAMSITLSGLIFGLVIARVLAGVIADLASWRDAYWMAVGLQGTVAGVLYLCLPDTPDKNLGLSYFGVLKSMAGFMITYPTLVQACIINFFTSATFAGFWTSLTFLLSDAPYAYSPLTIGLIGLVGLVGALLAPQWGRLVDRIEPWLGQLLGVSVGLVAMAVALAAASLNVGAVCVVILLYDTGQQLQQVASNYRVAGIDPKARARLNGCCLVCLFAGQASGTAIMTSIYNAHGWRPTGACALAFCAAALAAVLARGPHETGWVGWHGGAQVFRRRVAVGKSSDAVTERQRGEPLPVLREGVSEMEMKNQDEDRIAVDSKA
ncbi:hypothetical protein Q5752_001573 [Cryptotrichosporon argae]